jgi:hypothetical protein
MTPPAHILSARSVRWARVAMVLAILLVAPAVAAQAKRPWEGGLTPPSTPPAAPTPSSTPSPCSPTVTSSSAERSSTIAAPPAAASPG